jgi:hypothetical protein
MTSAVEAITMMNFRWIALSSLLTAAAACGPAPGTRAHENTAPGHRADAAKTNYWLRTAHLRAAEELDANAAKACKGDETTTSEWPVVTSTAPFDGGIVLHAPAQSGSTDAVYSRIQCRSAVIARDGADKFPNDPLALDVDVVVHDEGGGTAIMLGIADDSQLPELERRIAATLASK